MTTEADLRQLDLWVDECQRSPGALPTGVEPVQTRLIRAVGRAELPDSGVAYIKTMGFPRGRDRLRYLFRALPALHEAEMLRRVRAVGVLCPVVLRAVGVRRSGWPSVSVLITEGLPNTRPADFARAAEIGAELVRVGLYHPDLNQGNFALVDAGRGVATLDLQSARWRGRRLGRSETLKMAAKLVLEFGDSADLETLVAAGFVAECDLACLRARVARMRRADVRRRVRRCLTPSTGFDVERRLGGCLYRRRDVAPESGIRVKHDQALRLWLGDRTLEVLDGTAPTLLAMFRKSWWLPGQSCVYISASDGNALSAAHEDRLLHGFARLREIEMASHEQA